MLRRKYILWNESCYIHRVTEIHIASSTENINMDIPSKFTRYESPLSPLALQKIYIYIS